MDQRRRIKTGKQLKRLCIADISFRQAGELAKFIMENIADAADLKYGPMLAGIIVTYAKNFVENTEFGTLRGPFTEFSDPAMYVAHHTAITVRHKVYAHRDLRAGRQFTHDDQDPAETYEVRIRLHDDGINCSANALLPDLPPDFLPTFVRLCDLQHTRARDELRRLIKAIRSVEQYSAGEYVIGSDFP